MRLKRIKDGEELRFGRAFIPFAITAKKFQQFGARVFNLARSMERLGIVKARLVVVWVCLDGAGQFGKRARLARLSRKGQLRARGIRVDRPTSIDHALPATTPAFAGARGSTR